MLVNRCPPVKFTITYSITKQNENKQNFHIIHITATMNL